MPVLGFLKNTDYRILTLFGACVIYAFAGSPTPSNFGIAEMLIGALLIVSIGPASLRSAIIIPKTQPLILWQQAGRILLIYGLSIPLLIGVLGGHSPGAMLRDIIPFLFLFLPLFLFPLIRNHEKHFKVLLIGLIMIGIVFALRAVLMRSHRYCSFWCTNELLYLENMPTVLFTALFLTGSAFMLMTTRLSITNIILSIAAIGGSAIALVPMILTQQRASLGAAVMYGMLLFSYGIIKRPFKTLPLIVIGLCFTGAALMVFEPVFLKLMQKTNVVGLNMRPQEFAAVWSIVTADWKTFLFGIGWGGQFHSPAVGGLSVNYTHNFFTSFLIKSGFCGMLLSMVYIGGILKELFHIIKRDPMLGLALSAPLLIDITLYASFKSLDFGLMLLGTVGALVYSSHSRFRIKSRINA